MKIDKMPETLQAIVVQDSMIEVFVTNVSKENEAEEILTKLRKRFSELDFSFDLEDCDKVL
jgi:hypothetical protein